MKLLIIGHSHINALKQAAARNLTGGGDAIDCIQLRTYATSGGRQGTSSPAGLDKRRLEADIAAARADYCIICTNGNDHFSLGLTRGDVGAEGRALKLAQLSTSTRNKVSDWLEYLLPLLPQKRAFMPAPPQLASDDLQDCVSDSGRERYEGIVYEPAAFRAELWQAYVSTLQTLCAARNLPVMPLPATVLDEQGRLPRRFWSDNLGHGNAEYGAEMLRACLAYAQTQAKGPAPVAMHQPSPHPYKSLPDSAFWKQSISQRSTADVDPVTTVRFQIGPQDKVATAGSCFAQHISKRLRAGGFQYFLAEPPPVSSEEAVAERRGFYDFSARYGNVYTARQLLQMFDRAHGYFCPLDDHWELHNGRFADPFRPRIEPDGFASVESLRQDRDHHLQCVRDMFATLDVFVFTLGLTECWISALDGAAYPVAPGTAGGTYDPKRHRFVNFTMKEVVSDMNQFLAKLALVNPKARVILTVSPVPLVATAADRHVLVSTVYSKSVLRVAAEELEREHAHVQYFPSYEIITGPHAQGQYFGPDRRSVTEAGVNHVMKIFMAKMTVGTDAVPQPAPALAVPAEALQQQVQEMQALAEAECDEEVLERN